MKRRYLPKTLSMRVRVDSEFRRFLLHAEKETGESMSELIRESCYTALEKHLKTLPAPEPVALSAEEITRLILKNRSF